MKYFSMIIVLGMLVLICGCPQEKSEDNGKWLWVHAHETKVK